MKIGQSLIDLTNNRWCVGLMALFAMLVHNLYAAQGVGVESVESAAAGTRPNIVFILSDDQGYGDLGCFGSETILTPHIDTIAEQGVKLTSFYVHNRCSPTRAALMTGSIGTRAGVDKVVYPRRGTGLSPDEITLAEKLKEAGYVTGIVGKWHLGDWPEFRPMQHGFDENFTIHEHPEDENGKRSYGLFQGSELFRDQIDKTAEYLSPLLIERGVQFIRDHAKSEQPFFLYYSSPIPHTPWLPHEDFAGSSEHGVYGDVIQELDWQVGQLLAELEAQGVVENTLVIFTSDNGPQLNVEGHGLPGPLRDGKWTDFEGGIRVPTAIRWPQHIPAGSEVNQITAITDMLPTFCTLAGVEVPNDRFIDGHDITTYLTGEHRGDPIYDTWIVPGSTIRKGDWKLLVSDQKVGGSRSDVRGMTTRVPEPAGSLFNLSTDLGERVNVAAQHPELVATLQAEMAAFMEELRQTKRPAGVSELGQAHKAALDKARKDKGK